MLIVRFVMSAGYVPNAIKHEFAFIKVNFPSLLYNLLVEWLSYWLILICDVERDRRLAILVSIA